MIEILHVENLNKTFDGVAPVKDVSFVVKSNTITLITGENGAGKTTLFNLITGLETPTRGKVAFNGENITGKSALEVARQGVTRLYQQPRLFRNLSVWENLVSAAHPRKGNGFFELVFHNNATRLEDLGLKEKAIDLLAKFGLRDLVDRVAGELSFGQQKLISFCLLAMNGTKLALLDEPFAGLNPETIKRLIDMILHMRDGGVTFVIIEHNVKKAMEIADQHIEMKNGRISSMENIGLK